MMERIAHYRELAAQFRQWAESETVPEARDVCLIWPDNTSVWRLNCKRAPRRRKTRQEFNRSQGAPNWTATMIEHPARKLLRAA